MISILITGCNGFIGRQLLRYLVSTQQYNVHATSQQQDAYPTPGYTFHTCDLTQPAEVELLLATIQPQVVIHSAAMSAIAPCEENPQITHQLNVEAVKQIADWCRTHSAHLIQFSTDFVFEGTQRTPYTETDQPLPINIYGRSKWQAEQYIQQHLTNYTVIRVVVVYGTSLPNQHGNIVELIVNKLLNNEEIQLASDQWRTPTYVGDICLGIHQIIQQQATGIYHLGGPETRSIYEMGRCIAEELNIDPSCLIPQLSYPTASTPRRPSYTALSIKKAQRELNYNPITLRQYIRQLIQAKEA